MSSPERESLQHPPAIDVLFQEFAADLLAFLLGLLRDHHLAEEALQATFAKAINQHDTIQNSNPRGWLFQVAYREAMWLRRKQGIEIRHLKGLAWLKNNRTASPDEPLIREEVVRSVRESLAALPPEQQQVVRKRIEENQTFAEIAAELGIPLGTVLTRMRLALQKLQKTLTDFE